jgi:hypothetical protein
VGPRFELLQEHWSPAARLLAGAAGGIVAIGALRRPGSGSGGLALAGVGLLARAATNVPAKRLVGLGAGTVGDVIAKSLQRRSAATERRAVRRE